MASDADKIKDRIIDRVSSDDGNHYPQLETAEYWLVFGGVAAIVARYGPYTAIECGEQVRKSVELGIGATIIMNCGKEIDWEMAADLAPKLIPVPEAKETD